MQRNSGPRKIKFSEKSHKYSIGKKRLTSVTQFISRFMSEFDANKIAKGCMYAARRRGEQGKGVRYWKNLWKKARDEGTDIHKEIFTSIVKDTVPSSLKARSAVDWFARFLRTTDEPMVLPESVVFSEELGLAGTIDVLIYSNMGTILIDWKTNKNITTSNKLKCKAPISHLDDCGKTKYMLQLSFYAYILEKNNPGLTIKDLYVVKLNDTGVEVYACTYLKKEVEAMIKHGTKEV